MLGETRAPLANSKDTLMTTSPTPAQPTRYVAPRGADRRFNAAVAWLTDHGVSLFGSRVLTVPGRRTGELRSTPVNLLELDGTKYLVAPRGNTQWVRNVRAAGGASLRVGRRVEQVVLTELPVGERLPVIRVYLKRWGWEVGRFVEGLTKDSSDADVLAVAPGMPVFRVEPATA
jgi:deazaflavin-dependent oxidoreductase (nitroreductase family)